MDSAHPIGLEAALHHGGVAADCGQKLALYGWLVGNWRTEVVTHDMEGKSHRGKGEIRAGWILEGRAIQDVWMIPPYTERDAGISVLPVSGTGTARPFERLTRKSTRGVSIGSTRPQTILGSRLVAKLVTTSSSLERSKRTDNHDGVLPR
jgi:hypothetical protein